MNMYSDDEISERAARASADAAVRIELALATFAATMDRAAVAFQDFTETCDELTDVLVARLTTDQRALYNGLVACGTPTLDAIVEADEL